MVVISDKEAERFCKRKWNLQYSTAIYVMHSADFFAFGLPLYERDPYEGDVIGFLPDFVV